LSPMMELLKVKSRARKYTKPLANPLAAVEILTSKRFTRNK